MIHLFDAKNLNRWNRGEYKVQLDLPGNSRPMGWCDGTPEDEAELKAMAEQEGVEHLPIAKRVLKTGRELWTLGLAQSGASDEGMD